MSLEIQTDYSDISWTCHAECSVCIKEINNKNNQWPCDFCEQWLCTECKEKYSCKKCTDIKK